MEIKVKAGSAAKAHGSKFLFNFIPYLFIDVMDSSAFVIQCGWLFWDCGIMFYIFKDDDLQNNKH